MFPAYDYMAFSNQSKCLVDDCSIFTARSEHLPEIGVYHHQYGSVALVLFWLPFKSVTSISCVLYFNDYRVDDLQIPLSLSVGSFFLTPLKP